MHLRKIDFLWIGCTEICCVNAPWFFLLENVDWHEIILHRDSWRNSSWPWAFAKHSEKGQHTEVELQRFTYSRGQGKCCINWQSIWAKILRAVFGFRFLDADSPSKYQYFLNSVDAGDLSEDLWTRLIRTDVFQYFACPHFFSVPNVPARGSCKWTYKATATS